MSYRDVDRAMGLKLKGLEKTVFLVLAWHRNKDTGDCFPGVERLALLAGASERAVKAAIKGLKDRGAIKVTTKVTSKGRRNEYELLFDNIPQVVRPAKRDISSPGGNDQSPSGDKASKGGSAESAPAPPGGGAESAPWGGAESALEQGISLTGNKEEQEKMAGAFAPTDSGENSSPQEVKEKKEKAHQMQTSPPLLKTHTPAAPAADINPQEESDMPLDPQKVIEQAKSKVASKRPSKAKGSPAHQLWQYWLQVHAERNPDAPPPPLTNQVLGMLKHMLKVADVEAVGNALVFTSGRWSYFLHWLKAKEGVYNPPLAPNLHYVTKYVHRVVQYHQDKGKGVVASKKAPVAPQLASAVAKLKGGAPTPTPEGQAPVQAVESPEKSMKDMTPEEKKAFMKKLMSD